jgi:hypothetical protein
MAQNQTGFNFSAFNTLTDNVPAGMKTYLAAQLLQGVVWSLEKYENEMEADAREILSTLKSFREDYKAQAEARAKAKGE